VVSLRSRNVPDAHCREYGTHLSDRLPPSCYKTGGARPAEAWSRCCERRGSRNAAGRELKRCGAANRMKKDGNATVAPEAIEGNLKGCPGVVRVLCCVAAPVFSLRSLLTGSVSGLQQRRGSAQGCETAALVCGLVLLQRVAASPIWPVMGQAHASVGSVVAKSASSVSTVQKWFCHFFI
jgi:hypothetical protein